MSDELMDRERLAEIRAALLAVPAPPWHWVGDTRNGPILATAHSGWRLVMGFRRLGMQGAQPEFPVRDEGRVFVRGAKDMVVPRAPYDMTTVRGIDNPVARWLQNSAQYVRELLADRNALARELADSRDRTLAAKQEAQKAQDLADRRETDLEKTRNALELLHARIHRDFNFDASESAAPDDEYWARLMDDLVTFADEQYHPLMDDVVEG